VSHERNSQNREQNRKKAWAKKIRAGWRRQYYGINDFSGFHTDTGISPESWMFGKLLQAGKHGEIPDIMRIDPDRAERLKPSSSDIVTHHSFLRFQIELSHNNYQHLERTVKQFV